MEYNVTKRDGRQERLDITKIQKFTKDAVEGLSNVSQSELEVDAKIQFYDGIKTSEIQELLIKSASEKVSIHSPDWTYVAARLFLYDLYHQVSLIRTRCKVPSSKHGKNNYPDIREHFDFLIQQGYVRPDIMIGYDMDAINKSIVPERDLLFSYIGIKTVHDRYLIKNSEGEAIELPQHMFMGIAMFLAKNEKDRTKWAITFYDVLSKFEFMVATPILSNARTKYNQLSSCYVGSIGDSLEGIMTSCSHMANISKYGGGIGYDVTQIRSIGSTIREHKGKAGGVIPFMKIVNDISIAFDQLGVRKGAIAVYLEVWHKDILDFIDLRKNSGEERRRAHDIFPSVWICDLFMKRVKDDDKWTLFDPYETRDLCECYGEEFETKYIAYENNELISRVEIRAKDLWKSILLNYFEAGLPFLGFKDNSNRANPNKEHGMIRSSNLCVTGDTRILTKEYGNIEIYRLVDNGVTKALCWNGEKFSETELFKTSDGQKVLTVKIEVADFSDRRRVNVFIRATPEHKWYVKEGEEIVEHTTSTLQQGMMLDMGQKPPGIVNYMYAKIVSVEDLNEFLPTYCGNEPERHRLLFNYILTGNCTEIFQNTEPSSITKQISKEGQLVNNTYNEDGSIAVCNLGSLNISKVYEKEDIERVVPVAIRMLDDVIDLNLYPNKEAYNHNIAYRSIGLGIMGEAEMLAKNHIYFGSDEHKDKIDEVMSDISYTAIKTSHELSEEKGSYDLFLNSEWNKGVLPMDHVNDQVVYLLPCDRRRHSRWEPLRENVKKGMRNGYIMAIAPTSSISLVTNTTPTIEAIYKKMWLEENLSGLIPLVVPNLNKDTEKYYTSVYDVDQQEVIKLAAIRQKWIDQGQSMNIMLKVNQASGKVLNDIYMLAWELGIKSTYYLRSESIEAEQETNADMEQNQPTPIMNRQFECEGCQ